MIGFIDHSQVVTTTKHNALADSHTATSQCAFTSPHYPFPDNGFIAVTVTSAHTLTSLLGAVCHLRLPTP
jgi:hypothetical protein